MGNVKYLRYEGTKAVNLVRGERYTYKQFAEEANVGYRCMVSRLHNKHFVTDKDLEPLNAHKIPKQWRNEPVQDNSRFDHYLEVVSQKWLSRRL